MTFDLKAFIGQGPKTFKPSNLFSVAFEGDDVDPEDSKFLSFCCYRVNQKSNEAGIRHALWFFVDEDQKVVSALDRVMRAQELSIRLTEYDRAGEVAWQTLYDLIGLEETETEFDWGTESKVAYIKLTFASTLG